MLYLYVLMMVMMMLDTLAATTEDWKDPHDVLINPRGQKVCLQQCGTPKLLCPEAFFLDHSGSCFRCCSIWNETVIRIDCKDSYSAAASMPKSISSWLGNATTTSMSNATISSPARMTEQHYERTSTSPKPIAWTNLLARQRFESIPIETPTPVKLYSAMGLSRPPQSPDNCKAARTFDL
ncbi:hypothetical protein IAQ61_008677, partial [Plenodomus lingam]|uniref:uncharacterized protein n=1 Tax=Leptosphaeria maculans TaxID=5022 RepID=UPI00332D63A1